MANEVKVGSDDEAETTDAVICLPLSDEHPLMMPDNEIGTCAECGRPVQFRPHAPKSPPRICMPCALPLMEAMHKQGELGVVVTQTTVAEIKKRMMN